MTFFNKSRGVSMGTINLRTAFNQIESYWHPHVAAEANGQHFRLTKLKGAFDWHDHAEEDEVFIVLEGQLTVNFEDRAVEVKAGELLVIHRGVAHQPVADAEVHLLNITAAGTSVYGDDSQFLGKSPARLPRLQSPGN